MALRLLCPLDSLLSHRAHLEDEVPLHEAIGTLGRAVILYLGHEHPVQVPATQMHPKLHLGLFDEDNAGLWGLLVGIPHSPFGEENRVPSHTQSREEEEVGEEQEEEGEDNGRVRKTLKKKPKNKKLCFPIGREKEKAAGAEREAATLELLSTECLCPAPITR